MNYLLDIVGKERKNDKISVDEIVGISVAFGISTAMKLMRKRSIVGNNETSECEQNNKWETQLRDINEIVQ